MHENIVRGDAGLPGIQELALGDPLAGQAHVRIGAHDGGALTSKLQRDGSEMPGSSLHHDLSHPRATGKEYIVILPGQHLFVRDRIIKDLYYIRAECSAKHSGDRR